MKQLEGSIKTLFIACIVIITGVLLTVQTVINVNQFQGSMESQVQTTLEHQAEAIAGKLDQRILQIAQKTSGISMYTSSLSSYSEDVLLGAGKRFIESDPLVLGSGYWFAPNAYQAGVEYYGPYQMRDGGSIKLTMEYSNAEYNYF